MAFKNCDSIEAASSVLMDERTRTLSISGPIDKDACNTVLFGLQSLEQKKGGITIFINSQGGDVYSGLGIYDLIGSCVNLITGVAVGSCMSAAVTILMACDVRLASPECRLMIHEVQNEMPSMSTSLLARYAGEGKLLDKRLKEILAERSSLTPFEIDNLCKDDSFLSASEAEGYGMIDGLFTNFSSVKNKRSR
jgi:ATP-dependent Clp protease protease subunit